MTSKASQSAQRALGVEVPETHADKNKRFLETVGNVLGNNLGNEILEAIATHYGISTSAALVEVTLDPAEHLCDYLVEPLRSRVAFNMSAMGLF